MLVVVGLIGFIGWYVWHNKNNTNKVSNTTGNSTTQTPSTKSYTDTSKTFTFNYPSNWTIKKYVHEPCCEGEPKPEPDWTKVPQPITLIPKDAPKNIEVTITGGNTGAKSIDKAWLERTIDKFNTYDRFQVNSYDALDQTTDFVGSSNVEAYIDHRDLIVHGKNSVEIYFRQKYRHDWNKENNFDATKYMPVFNAVVNSVKFLN